MRSVSNCGMCSDKVASRCAACGCGRDRRALRDVRFSLSPEVDDD